MLRRTLIAVAVLVAALSVAPFAAAAIVHIRVEGKTVTIFGSTEPRVSRRRRSRRSRQRRGAAEFYYHVTASSFGNYVDQVGLYGGSGSAGWVFKVNGVSPPVGADQVQLKDGDVVEWYYATFGATGGPPTLELKTTVEGLLCSDGSGRHGSGEGACRARLPRRRALDPGGGRTHLLHQGARARLGDRSRRRALEPPAVIRSALVAVAAAALLAGCGGSGAGHGTATLWLTRDEGDDGVARAVGAGGRDRAPGARALDRRSRRGTAGASCSR